MWPSIKNIEYIVVTNAVKYKKLGSVLHTQNKLCGYRVGIQVKLFLPHAY